MPLSDCCHYDAHLDTARTSPTNDARRASSRSCRDVRPSRGGVLPRLQRPWPVVASSSTHDREAASGSPGAASRSRPDPWRRQMSNSNDLAGRARWHVGSSRRCWRGHQRSEKHRLRRRLGRSSRRGQPLCRTPPGPGGPSSPAGRKWPPCLRWSTPPNW